MKYIDVSQWQGTPNWEKVQPNVSGVLIRAGYGLNHIDPQFVRNATECNRLGISIGAYWFSYALTPEMARQEAEYLLSAVKPFRVELPLAFDFEYDSADVAAKNGVTVTPKLVSDMARAFCETIEAAGYYVLNYTNPDYLDRFYDDDVEKRFGTWLAAYPAAKVYDVSKPPRGCQIWQHSSKGSVPGITGNVDLDEAYHDFKTVILNAGLNHLDGGAAEPEPDPQELALEWMRANDLCRSPEVTIDDFPTWGELALALRCYNSYKEELK